MAKRDSLFATIIPATRILQTLTRRGGIKAEYIDDAQAVITRGKVDYSDCVSEFFEAHLQEMKHYINEIKQGQRSDQIINDVSSSIANFRANISMISEDNYIDICSELLRWIESIKIIDTDAIDMLDGYYVSLERIFEVKELSNKQISLIALEITDACQRYFDKHSELEVTKNINNTKALYVSDTCFGFDIDKSSFPDDENRDYL